MDIWCWLTSNWKKGSLSLSLSLTRTHTFFISCSPLGISQQFVCMCACVFNHTIYPYAKALFKSFKCTKSVAWYSLHYFIEWATNSLLRLRLCHADIKTETICCIPFSCDSSVSVFGFVCTFQNNSQWKCTIRQIKRNLERIDHHVNTHEILRSSRKKMEKMRS